MKMIGKVTVILNSTYFLAEVSEELRIGTKAIVFQEVVLNEQDQKSTGLEKVTIPKGNYRVVALQEKGVYLLSFTRNHTSAFRSNLAASLLGMSNVFGQFEKVETKLGEGDAAKLDEKESLNLVINPKVQVGDYLAKS